jgi:hypothetical protein
VGLRKTRAQFELRLLDDPDLPEDVVGASWSAYRTACVLLNETEERRNGGSCFFFFLSALTSVI